MNEELDTIIIDFLVELGLDETVETYRDVDCWRALNNGIPQDRTK